MNNKWVHFFMIGYLALDGGLKYCNQRVPVSVCPFTHMSERPYVQTLQNVL